MVSPAIVPKAPTPPPQAPQRAGETVSHEDHVLATLTDEAAVVRIEAVPGNQAIAERVFVFGADKARVLREESLKVGDAEIVPRRAVALPSCAYHSRCLTRVQ